MICVSFFFFKQKTAYEMVVCLEFRRVLCGSGRRRPAPPARSRPRAGRPRGEKIGRAPCRERVWVPGDVARLKKKPAATKGPTPLSREPPTAALASNSHPAALTETALCTRRLA